MVNRLFIPPANRAFSDTGTPLVGAKLYVTETGTNTEVPLYADSDLENALTQPLVSDSDGVFETAYADTTALVRILITDVNDVPLNSYPQDDVALWPGDAADASGVAFSPTDAVPATNVQAAIEAAAALSTDQTSLIVRNNTVWTTGGTGNAYTLTPTPAILAYVAGQAFWIRPDRTNTGAVTININGLGARDVMKTRDVADTGTAGGVGTPGAPTALIRGDFAAHKEIQVADDGVRLMVLTRRDDLTFGSDANGIWDRFGSGLVIVTGTGTLTYATSSTLTGTVTFPNGGFAVTAKHVVPQLVSLTATNAGYEDIGHIRNSAKTTTTATFIAYRAAGGESFVNGDTMSITYEAIGRV